LGGYPWVPEYPVYTAWDLGYKDDTVVWFYQKPPGGFTRIIDYYESNQKGMLQYANMINQKPYFYGQHYAPHDVRKHELGTGKTILEAASKYGLNFKVVRKIPIQDGISYVRSFLPRCYFNTDNEHVAEAVDHIRSYRRDYDERLSVFRKKPLHDGASHAADGFRYLAVSFEDDDPSMVGNKVPPGHLVDHYKRCRPLSREKQSVFDLPNNRGNIVRVVR
jgi:phage terminase large subunit